MNFNSGSVIGKLLSTGGGIVKTFAASSGSNGITVDASGFIYSGSGMNIFKISPLTGNADIYRATVNYKQVAVDVDGIIYSINNTDKKLYKFTSLNTLSSITSAFSAPSWLATDAGNNIYVADKTTIKKIAPDRTTVTTMVSGLSTGINVATSIILDGRGYLYLGIVNNPDFNPNGAHNVYLKKIKPSGGYHLNKQLPKGLYFDNNTGIISGTPSVVAANSKYTIYAYNASGGVDSANIIIKVLSNSNNANLKSINASHTLHTAFNKDTLNYRMTVVQLREADDVITFTPTAAEEGATIKVNGVAATSGVSKYIGPVDDVPNIITIEVTAPDGVTKKTYTIKANRPQSAFGALHVTFSPYLDYIDSKPGYGKGSDGIYRYSTSVYWFQPTNVDITPSVGDPGATISYNGIPITPASPSFNVTLDKATNIFPVSVHFSNGENRIYHISVYRELFSEMRMNISVDKGVLTPAFSGLVTSYKDTVSAESIKFNIGYGNNDPTLTLMVNGIDVEGATYADVPLNEGHNSIPMVLTYGGKSITYTFDIFRTAQPVSNKALLSSIVLTPAAALTEVSGTADFNYTATVATADKIISVIPTAEDQDASIKVNGVIVASGQRSAPISLNDGNTIISIVVTSPDSTVIKNYSIKITRPKSTDASLVFLGLAGIKIDRVGTTDNYTASVSQAVTTVYQTATSRDNFAFIKVNGLEVTSGAQQSFALNLTGPTVLNTLVTADDSVTTRLYTLTIKRAGSNNASLTQLTIPGIKKDRVGTTDNYTVSLSPAQNSVDVSAATSDTNASIKVNGVTAASGSVINYPLNATGLTVLNIVVTAEDGITNRTYTLTVSRAGSNNASLTRLSILGTKVYQNGSIPDDYYTTVGFTQTTSQLVAVTSDNNATIKVNNTAIISGATQNISLGVEETVLNIVVTAQDGVTKRTYRVTLFRAGSEDPSLTRLSLLGYTLTRVGTTDNYTTTAALSQTSVQQIAVPRYSLAALKVNGVTATSGVPLTIALNATGITVINTVVTAENGYDTRTYAVTVSKPSALLMASTAGKNVNIIKDASELNATDVDDLIVPQGLSPNGDGINDRLVIAGVTAYPINTVKIMNQNGDVIYQASGYDNSAKAFDGHDSKGILQKAGTYFYSVEYKDGSETKRKTGYLVIKY